MLSGQWLLLLLLLLMATLMKSTSIARSLLKHPSGNVHHYTYLPLMKTSGNCNEHANPFHMCAYVCVCVHVCIYVYKCFWVCICVCALGGIVIHSMEIRDTFSQLTLGGTVSIRVIHWTCNSYLFLNHFVISNSANDSYLSGTCYSESFSR